MSHLYQLIQQRVTAWREAGYPTDDYPAIAEILDYATLPQRGGQLRDLEIYWYLRLVEGIPPIFDLYRRYYAKPIDLLAALGLDRDEIKDFVLNEGMALEYLMDATTEKTLYS